MSKNLWAKYQQENRERLQKKLDQNLPKEGKEKKQQHGREPYKTLSKNKEKRKKNWLSIEKILQNEKKCFIIIIRKYFHLEILLLYKGKCKKLFLFCGYY